MGNADSKAAAATTSGGLIKKPQTQVLLNVYEPQQGQSGVAGFGIYHTGIEMSGVEYCFAGAEDAPAGQTGVMAQTPRVAPPGSQWAYKQTVDLGKTDKLASELSKILEDCKKEFPATSYHIIHRNCNHFSEHVCKKLGLKTFPSWVNRAANLSKALTPTPANVKAALQTAKENEKEVAKSVFASGKGYRLENGEAVDMSKEKRKSGSKKAEAAAPSAQAARKNPWTDPNFVAQKTGKSTSTTSTDTASMSASRT